MLLIYPPVAKPCEPPAGIAQLAGVLRGSNFPCTLLDANLEGLFYLLETTAEPADTWGRRAYRNLESNLIKLRSPELYTHQDRYRRAVADVNRMLDLAGQAHNISLSLANYQDTSLSPLKSDDLLKAAGQPDQNIFYPYFSKRLPKLLEQVQPRIVGFSLNYLSQALTTFAMIGFIKRTAPNVPIVLGGGLVTSWMSNPSWNNPFARLVDHLVSGPGEKALLQLLGKKDFSGHHPPDFDGLPLEKYLAPGFILPYAASSGCYWNKCSFCPEKSEKNPYTALPTDQVLQDIKGLIKKTNPSLLHFLDNAISPALLKALAENPPGVAWYGFARVHPALADVDFCHALRKSGCVMLKLGLETGSQDVLDAMHKGINLEMVTQTLAALHKAGIATYVYLLFGTPSESIDQARQTLDFVERNARAITYLNLAIFNMPICSQETATLNVSGFSEGDLSLYTDFVHPQGWHRKNVRRFLDQEFKRNPAVATILRRDPLHFTSNHAPFFAVPGKISE